MAEFFCTYKHKLICQSIWFKCYFFDKFIKFVKIISFFRAIEHMFVYFYNYLFGKMEKVYKKFIVVICKKERVSSFLFKF